MADGVAIKDFAGGSVNVLTDEVTHGTFGTGQVQVLKQMDGTPGSTNMQTIDAAGSASVRQQDLTNSGTIAGAAQSVTLAVNGCSVAGIQITGTFSATLQFEGTIDGTNWVSLASTTNGTSTVQTSTTAIGVWAARLGGLASIRVRASAYTSGAATVSLRGVQVTGSVGLDTSLPAGANNIGKVTNVGTAATSQPTAVANGAVKDLLTDKLGRQVVVMSHVRDLQDSSLVTLTNTTTASSLISAVASTFNDIVGLVITNSSATTGTWVEILDVAAVKMRVWVPAGGGGPIPLPIPLKQATVNTAWNARTTVATTEVTVCAQSVRNI